MATVQNKGVSTNSVRPSPERVKATICPAHERGRTPPVTIAFLSMRQCRRQACRLTLLIDGLHPTPAPAVRPLPIVPAPSESAPPLPAPRHVRQTGES